MSNRKTDAEIKVEKPIPTPDGDSQAMWVGLNNGQLLLQHCNSCGHVQYYQQKICRHCQSNKLEHKAASGNGTIYSYSIVYRAPSPAFKKEVPYAVLLVELEEGPRMISRLVGDDFDALTFDSPARLQVVKINKGTALPYFSLI